MRRKILLIAALTLSLGLNRSYAVSAEAVAAPSKGLDDVNRALRWRTASITLVSGRTDRPAAPRPMRRPGGVTRIWNRFSATSPCATAGPADRS